MLVGLLVYACKEKMMGDCVSLLCTCVLWGPCLWVCQGGSKCGCLCWSPCVSAMVVSVCVCVCVCVQAPFCTPVRKRPWVVVCVCCVCVCCGDYRLEFPKAVPSVDNSVGDIYSTKVVCVCVCVCVCVPHCVCL